MTVTNNYVTLCLIQTLQHIEFTPIYSIQFQVRVLRVISEKNVLVLDPPLGSFSFVNSKQNHLFIFTVKLLKVKLNR